MSRYGWATAAWNKGIAFCFECNREYYRRPNTYLCPVCLRNKEKAS